MLESDRSLKKDTVGFLTRTLPGEPGRLQMTFPTCVDSGLSPQAGIPELGRTWAGTPESGPLLGTLSLAQLKSCSPVLVFFCSHKHRGFDKIL